VFKVDAEQLDDEVLTNAAYVFTEMVNKKSQLPEPAKFDAFFASKDFLDIIFENLFRHEALTSCLAGLINTILQVQIQVWLFRSF
jgi:hypothetical protein